jgi:replicative DNA helicase
MELHNKSFEQSVIGGLLIDPAMFADVRGIVTCFDFYNEECRSAFEAMIKLADQNQIFDFMVIADELEKTFPTGKWLTNLATIQRNTPSAANVVNYAVRVEEYATLRKLDAAGRQVCHSCRDPDYSVQDKIANAQNAVLAITRMSGPRGPKQAAQAAIEWWDTVCQAAESHTGFLGISTGFHSLDQRILGMAPGEMIVVAGRPGAGKTALALNVAMNVVNRGQNVVFYSLEMAQRELMGRIASAETSIPYEDILRARLTQDQQSTLTAFVPRIKQMPLHIDDDATVHINDIRARSRAMAQREKIDLIIIDYLQLANGDGKSKYEKVTDVSRGIKLLAREIDCPVIALSQLNRESTKRNGPPDLADLRDSGAIEQDADSVWFLHSPDEYKTELIVAKLRKGRTGSEWFDKRLDIMRLVPGASYIPPPQPEKPFSNKRRSFDL